MSAIANTASDAREGVWGDESAKRDVTRVFLR